MPPGGDGERAATGGDGALVIAATCTRWDGYQGFNERDVFGTTEPAAIAHEVDRFCRAELGSGCVPTFEESLAFIADYEEARGSAFSADELRVLRASLVAAVAYSARCEHSDELTAFGTRPPVSPSAAVPAGGFCAYLAANGPALLGAGPPVPPVSSS
jgi:hypothetical protein